jgi:ASC-1-like (ASCH) protein
MPLFKTKREFFNRIKRGQKTIDIRREEAWKGDTAVIQCGLDILQLTIIKKETGNLGEIVTEDNYRAIIPLAISLERRLSICKSFMGTLRAFSRLTICCVILMNI